MTKNSSFKVAVLTHGDCLEFLKAAEECDSYRITDVFVETNQTKQRSLIEKLRRSVKYDGIGATCSKMIRRKEYPTGLLHADSLKEYCTLKDISFNTIEKFHSALFKSKLRESRPDLGVLFGTNIIKKSVYQIPRLGSVNIHRGKIPYYRGGPPVFWELFNGETEVGITAHFVAPAVDTGEIIIQETVPLKYDYEKYGPDIDTFLEEFGETMRKSAAEITARAVEAVANGSAKPVTPDLSLGQRYRIPTYKQKKELIKRIIKRVS